MEGSFLNLKKSIANILPEGRNYKAILSKINKTNKDRDTPCLLTGRFDIVRMFILTNLIYKFKMLIKLGAMSVIL